MKPHTTILLLFVFGIFMMSPAYAQNGDLQERSLMQGDSLRSYLLYVPTAYDDSSAWPVVLNYHGYTNTAAAQVEISQMNASADSANFLVAYPQGLIVDNPFAGTSNLGWNILGGTLSENDDLEFSLNIIDDISQDYLVDTTSIHATGWSMGAGMAYELVCAHAEKIASFAAVAEQMDNGTIENCMPGRAIPFLQIHGTADPIVPFNGASVAGITLAPTQETALFWAQNNSCLADPVLADFADLVTEDSSTVTVTEYGGCENSSDVRFYQINNGGHTWPGGGELPAFVGFVNKDFNASTEILTFFSGKLPPVVATSTQDEIKATDVKANIYPNPFKDHFTIDFEIAQTANVTIKLYNLLGQEMSTIIDQHVAPGTQRITWRPANQPVSSGLYFLRIKLGDELLTKSIHYVAN